MMHRSLPDKTKRIFILLLLLGTGFTALHGQENISGVINKFAKVNSFGPGYVIINDLAQISQFSAGNYVLMIQMQGVGIQTVQGSYGVNVQTKIGEPGGYEFLIIQSVDIPGRRINFTRNVFFNIYNANGNIQLIQVPFYNSPTVTGTLTTDNWNSTTGTGGVLAMFAGRRLTFNADIDVTGKGFSGAQGVFGIGECVFQNEPANNHDSYPVTWNNAGFKGEGVAIHDAAGVLLYPNHAKGQGRNFTGGGGGNGWFSGGGGGSNRGKGGDGGLEKYVFGLCGNDPRDGGFGGMNIIGTIIQNGIFAGGGGGASTQANGSAASPGGNGGGIVIIIADTIVGNSHMILSDGIQAVNAVSDAGAGGGGAGGSVAVSFQGIRGQIQISSKGGAGGINAAGFGGGGGGGGGLIWLSSISMPAAVTSANVAYGLPGPASPNEGTGEIKHAYVPRLNGFLFNSIRSVASGNQIDSVCSNTLFGQITGTQPVGGTPPYSFQWQSSITSATAGFGPAAGTNNQQHYTPPSALPQTTWFRRVVTDNGASITDISLPVMVVVHPNIKNNVIGDPATLCYEQNPAALHSLQTLIDGNGKYDFKWETSTDNSTYTGVTTVTENYLPPPGLTVTTWYRRTVTSGSCVSTSLPVRIMVLDTIRNNTILTPSQEICSGMLFTDLSGSAPPTLSGGDNTFRFRWESSVNGSSWVNASGTYNGTNYNPNETSISFPGQEYYRRVVLSGTNNVCENVSKPVLLTQYPLITNNVLTSGSQTICSGSVPVQITGSLPLNGKGAGTYTYTWQDSTKNHSWADITGFVNVTNQNFSPPALTDTTRYRRIVNSSVCVSISKSIIVNVHKAVINNNTSLTTGLTDSTICSGSTPNRLAGSVPTGGLNIPGSFAFQWSLSSDNSNWTDISNSGTGRHYQPVSLTSTTYFRRRATSGLCSSESGSVRIQVLPAITGNTVSADQTVCRNNLPVPLGQTQGVIISGGAGSGSYSFLWEESTNGTSWIPAPGQNNAPTGSYQPPAVIRPVKYRRFVTSGPGGCCTSTSDIIDIAIDSLPPGAAINAGRDTTINSLDHILRLYADPVFEGATGKWSVLDGLGSFSNDADNTTLVNGLSDGMNRFLWTVTRGACKLEDMVEIYVYDLSVPEGFSPNGDAYNNTFTISGLDIENHNAELTILNGAGNVVFSTTNINGAEWKDWDGKNSKGTDLPEGTYYYLLKIVSVRNGDLFRKSGFVILKRY